MVNDSKWVVPLYQIRSLVTSVCTWAHGILKRSAKGKKNTSCESTNLEKTACGGLSLQPSGGRWSESPFLTSQWAKLADSPVKSVPGKKKQFFIDVQDRKYFCTKQEKKLIGQSPIKKRPPASIKMKGMSICSIPAPVIHGQCASKRKQDSFFHFPFFLSKKTIKKIKVPDMFCDKCCADAKDTNSSQSFERALWPGPARLWCGLALKEALVSSCVKHSDGTVGGHCVRAQRGVRGVAKISPR